MVNYLTIGLNCDPFLPYDMKNDAMGERHVCPTCVMKDRVPDALIQRRTRNPPVSGNVSHVVEIRFSFFQLLLGEYIYILFIFRR